MENELYAEFAARFAAASPEELEEAFNHEVGNNGWCFARSCHDISLLKEMIRRGIDVSPVYKDHAISFRHRIRIDGDRVVVLNDD